MKDQIDLACEALQKEMLQALARLISIPSVKGPKEKQAPYGQNIRWALDEALKIAQELGFKTKDVKHHIGYAYTQASDEYIGIFGHLDVVEAKGEWSYPPFSLTKNGPMLYGRGVLDNKGPLMACLFALKAIEQCHLPLTKAVRIVFGCDEESGMNDIPVYLKHEKAPLFGFTPDCKFPVVYSERGRLVFEIHGSLALLVLFMNQYVLGSEDIAKRMNLDLHYPPFGKVEIRAPKLFTQKNHPYFQAVLVYPYTCDVKVLEEKIKSCLSEGLTYRALAHLTPLYHDPHEKTLNILSEAYQKVMGELLEPVTTTGGTYAKALHQIVPFGPSFPGQKGIAHLPDEWMNEEDLLNMCKIYAHAIYQLASE